MLKLKKLLKEDNGGFPEITHQDALKIANDKLKQLGFGTISDFNDGWGNSGKSSYDTSLSVPKELKPFVKEINRHLKVSGNIDYHSTYNPKPNIKIRCFVTCFRYQKIDGGYNAQLGAVEYSYDLKTKKWTEEKL